MNVDMNSIGNRIKKRRKELNLTQTDMFNKSGITSGALSKIENGTSIPSIIVFYKIAYALECDMNWLVTGSSYSQNHNTCSNEVLFLNGFRELPVEEQNELMGILQLKMNKLKNKNL